MVATSALALALLSAPARADEDAGEDPSEELVVEAEAAPTSPSSRSLDRAAVEAFPARSADALLRAMPGLHQSAHGGHGKAYQYFLRGFDAVHGADLAVDLEGVPVNEVSNVHAHGYLDLHLVPAVLVQGVDLSPGAWRPEAGDFAVAGAASLHLGLEQAGGLLAVGGGTDRSGEATLAWRPRGARPGSFVVADADLGMGVGQARSWRQLRGGVGAEGLAGGARLRAWLLAYDGAFDSPGVLRADDYEAGEFGFYDAYPGSGGGRSRRALGAVQLDSGGAALAGRALAWAGWRDLALEQNFTGWYGDATHGDGTRQEYQAWTVGARGSAWWHPGAAVSATGGVVGRLDLLEQRELAIEPDGTPWEERAALAARQGSAGAWLSTPLAPATWLRVEPGLRGEVFLVDVDGQPLAWAPVLAPRAHLALFPEGPVRGVLAYGRGYRSPDARAAGDGGRAPLSRSDSLEVGGTAAPGPRWSLRGAAFGTFVSDEIVFDHVAARYLATGRTRRLGLDAGLAVRPVEGLRVEADLTWADGRYTDTGEPIPYAPRVLGVAGVYATDLALGAAALTAGLRAWALGPRPLPGGFHSHPAAVLDLVTRLARGPWGASLEVDNLLGTRWRDGEFVFPSWWDRAEARAELPVRHYTAGAPFAARLSLSRSFP